MLRRFSASFLLAWASLAAQMTPVVASSVTLGNVLVTGTITFTATDRFHHPVGFIAGGKSYAASGFRATVTAGIIQGNFSVPDLCLASPLSSTGPLRYQVYVFDKAHGLGFTVSDIDSVCGTDPWDFGSPTHTASTPAGALVLADLNTGASYGLSVAAQGLTILPASGGGSSYSSVLADTVTGRSYRMSMAGGVLQLAGTGVSSTAAAASVRDNAGNVHNLSVANGLMVMDASPVTGSLLLADTAGSAFYRLTLSGGLLQLVPADGAAAPQSLVLADGTTGTNYLLGVQGGTLQLTSTIGGNAYSSLGLVDTVSGLSQSLTVSNGQLTLN